MNKKWLGAILCILTSWTISSALADPVATLDRSPLEGIHTFDRIDLDWTLGLSGADSTTVSFGDGTSVTMPASQTTVRHFYSMPGTYDVTFTVWVEGHPNVEVMDNLVRITTRSVPGTNVMFLHHSTGRLLIKDSGFRSLVDWHNEQSGTDIRFWDHDYAYGNDYTGVILPDSTVHQDWIYGNEANNIQPSGYHEIFVNAPAFRDSLFSRHQVIIFKNDHSTGDIVSDAQLDEYKQQYLEIRNILDQHPEKLFILVSGPPRRPEKTTPGQADRTRAFYEWLQSPEFMNGHDNLAFFDLFDQLAYPDDPGNPEANMLREEYRRPDLWDDHPSELANVTIGPIMADTVLRILDPDFYDPTSPVPAPDCAHIQLHAAVPNPFNPATRIAWERESPGIVSLKVFDVSGRLVRTLVNNNL